jgi:hypothetical protein
LKKIRRRRALKRLNNPDRRDRILNEFNRYNTPDVRPIGGDQSMAVLNDINELQAWHDEFVKSLARR